MPSKDKYKANSPRWHFWDYSVPGSYFITICVADRVCILGEVENGKMKLSACGKFVADEFSRIPEYHPRVSLDVSVVMPNHVHCILTLGNYKYYNGISKVVPLVPPVAKIPESSLLEETETSSNKKQYIKQRRQMLLPKIIGKFKMLTSKKINELRQTPSIKNWQTSFHDHIIRDKAAYERIKWYIIHNPKKWSADRFYES